MASNNNIMVANLVSRFATILLTPIFDNKSHITTFRFDGYRRIDAIFPDLILAQLVAEKLNKSIDTEILFEELLLVRELIQIPLHVDPSKQITRLDGIGYLANLKILRIHNGNLETLPGEMKHLFNLVELDITASNLTSCPDVVYDLTSLVRLKLRQQKITSISKYIKNLSKLEIFDLSENMIEVLPVEIGLLDNVIVFSIQGNPLKKLPNEVGYMDCLESLDVSETKLTTIPISLVKAKTLRILNVNHTEVFQIDDVFYSGRDTPLKIIGEQFSVTTAQLDMINKQKTGYTKKQQVSNLVVQTLTIAGVITTCVVLIIGYNMKKTTKKNKRTTEKELT